MNVLASIGGAIARFFSLGPTASAEPRFPSSLAAAHMTDAEGRIILSATQPLIDPALNDVLLTATPLDRDGLPHAVELSWHCNDTSVLRLKVAADTLSALGTVVGEGVATVTVSDGEALESRQVVVERTRPEWTSSIDLGLEVIGKRV